MAILSEYKLAFVKDNICYFSISPSVYIALKREQDSEYSTTDVTITDEFPDTSALIEHWNKSLKLVREKRTPEVIEKLSVAITLYSPVMGTLAYDKAYILYTRGVLERAWIEKLIDYYETAKDL